MKFGFEFEAINDESLMSNACGDCHGCGDCSPDYDEIYYKLNESNHIINDIKEDGSIPYDTGFEINSVVFDDIKEFKKGLIDLVKNMKHEGIYTESPCAIHLHCSNIKSPLKFKILSHCWDDIYTIIRGTNCSGLMFHKSNIDTTQYLPPYNNKINLGNMDFREYLRNIGFSSYRNRTIRNRIQTLEFRPIPARLNKEYIKIWMGIYERLIKKSYSMSLDNIKKLYINIQNSPSNSKRISDFMEFFNLSNWDLFVLSHKINNNTKKDYKHNLDRLNKRDINLYEFMVL